MFENISLCFFFLFCLSIVSSEDINPVVQIQEGQLRGDSSISRDGRIFYKFLGIRYANLNLRFQVASVPEPWEGIQNATTFGSPCLSYYEENGTDVYIGMEDCLFLNVYTPKIPEGDESPLFPVMVFFHEGGFLYNSGNGYDPMYLMDENVVIVTINYRLSALGFLSTEDEEAAGNMGLKDQVKSLEWVQRNIRFFNGDPNKVTIFGYSAGGASVTYHLLSDMSRGLFHRALAQSGSALNPWAFAPRPLENAKVLARELGCLSNDTKDIVSCLQTKDARDIVKLQRKPFVKWFVDPLYVFVPSVEKIIGDGRDNFLTQTPRSIINSGSFSTNNVPLMTGSVKEDGLLLHGAFVAHDPALSQFMDFNWDFVSPITFFYQDIQESNSTAGKEISERIRNFYFNANDSIGWDTKFKLSHAYTDRWFLKGIKDMAVAYSQNTNATVFNYFVTYNKLKEGTLDEYFNETLDVSHGDDLFLLFKKSNETEIKQDSEHYNISKKYVKLWVNFATFGDPNGYEVTGTNWTTLNPNEQHLKWFHINETFQLTDSNFTDRSDFWNSLPVSQ